MVYILKICGRGTKIKFRFLSYPKSNDINNLETNNFPRNIAETLVSETTL